MPAIPACRRGRLDLLPFTGAWVSLRKLSEAFRRRSVLAGVLALGAFCLCGTLLMVENSADMLAQAVLPAREPRMAWGKNNPVGEAKGIYPGRVVWTHAPGAATWEKGTGFWFEDRWNSQEDADWLLQQSLLSLTGEGKGRDAWKALLTYFNRQHGKGKQGYRKGEKIAIKVNQNNTFAHTDCEQLNASPHLTLALLRSLVNDGGVPQEQITVFAASRFITDALFDLHRRRHPLLGGQRTPGARAGELCARGRLPDQHGPAEGTRRAGRDALRQELVWRDGHRPQLPQEPA